MRYQDVKQDYVGVRGELGLAFSHSEFDSGGRHTVIEDADSSR